MKIVETLSWKFAAMRLRRVMKRQRKAVGRNTELEALAANFRTIPPEYANELGRLLHPKTKITIDGLEYRVNQKQLRRERKEIVKKLRRLAAHNKR